MIWILSVFIYLLFSFKSFLSNRKSDTTNYTIIASAYLLIIQFIFAGFVAPHILTGRILIPFMIILGWAHALRVRSNRFQGQVQEDVK